MYTVIGIDHEGKESAHLVYETLDEAMQKLRDLVEADEIDDDGPMFSRYGMIIGEPKRVPPPAPSEHRLRLAGD